MMVTLGYAHALKIIQWLGNNRIHHRGLLCIKKSYMHREHNKRNSRGAPQFLPSCSNMSLLHSRTCLKQGSRAGPIFRRKGKGDYVRPDKLTGIDPGIVECKRKEERRKMLVELVSWKKGTFVPII